MPSDKTIPQKRTADSVFYDLTRSLCPVCKRVIDARGHLKENRVLMRKRCPEHGWFEALMSSDAEGYVNSLKYNKPGTIPLEFATEIKEGGPYDCGLCPEHKQHTCLALIEVNTGCNLACPTCFANAGPGYNLTLAQVETMLDAFVRAEGDPEVVQFSGGEPTLHPQLFDVIRMARQKGMRHVMVNTNGRRIARDAGWARELGSLRPMIYLQFDGLEDKTYVKLRGEPLLEEKLAALDRLAELDLSTILVAAVERGVNEHEVGALRVRQPTPGLGLLARVAALAASAVPPEAIMEKIGDSPLARDMLAALPIAHWIRRWHPLVSLPRNESTAQRQAYH